MGTKQGIQSVMSMQEGVTVAAASQDTKLLSLVEKLVDRVEKLGLHSKE